MDATPKGSTELQLRAALYARLSETYDAAESVPTQLANAGRHAARLVSFRDVRRFASLRGGIATKRSQEVDLAKCGPVSITEVQLRSHGLP